MAPSAWTALLLAAPLLLGLAAAYPHRAYHDEADGAVQEKNVRHIDGLGVQQTSDAARQLEEQVRRQVEEQVRATGSGSASGQWSVTKHSEYSGGGSVPVRATITGEALEGGDGLMGITTNCHNCRLRIRKVGGGSSSGAGVSEQAGGAGGVQVESSQSRYYSSRSEGGQGGQSYGSAHPVDLSGGLSGGRLVQSSQQQQYSAGGYGSSPGSYGRVGAVDADGLSSSRRDTKVTKSSWQLADLGYGTSNIEDLIRRLDEDMRAGRYQNGKTVTTVTTTTSENGSPPVTRQETYVKDGLDMSQSQVGSLDMSQSQVGSLGHGFAKGGTTSIVSHSEIEDLLRGLREELRTGKTEAGKTVTTVVESSSVNGAAPVVTKKTYVRDGYDASALELGAAGLDAGFGQSGVSGNSGSHSLSRTTQSVWSSGGVRPLGVDHLGGGNLLTNSHHLARNSTTVSTYGSGSGGHDVRTVDALGGGHLIRESGGYGATSGSEVKGTRRVDALGGGHLLRETGGGYGATGSYGSETSSSYKETRRVDALGGGHLIRDTEGSDLKGTRRVDALGGGHLIRGTDSAQQGASYSGYSGSASSSRFEGQAALQPRPTTDTLSVSQMPGYRKDAPLDTDLPAYGSNSKYYSTFQTSSYTSGAGGVGGAGVVDSSLAGSQTALGGLDSSLSGSSDGDTRTSSSSSYKKVVKYSSSGSTGVELERDLDHLGGGHLIRGVPSTGDGQRTQDVGGNQAFIASESGRIPEAGSGSYFSSGSSSYQRASSGSSGINGVNPGAPTGAVVVPVRGPAASSSVISVHGSRSEWAEAQETNDDEFPALGPAAPTSPGIVIGYGSGNGGYGGGTAARPAVASGDSSVQRGGKLSVSLADIGILPSDGSTQQASSGYSSSGSTRYSSSAIASETEYGATGGSGYGTSGSGYGASGSGYGASGTGYGASGTGYGASGSGGYGARSSSTYSSSRHYEVPVASHGTSWSSQSSYSSGMPSRASSSYGSLSQGSRGQRMTQTHTGPDCDGTVKI
ncbi:hornerin-like [Frankliniella occidentalis]|uniref:Hornerin-like n=1 Tax=Frankliniella occidentalis TaxID=133901 RepID=A0A9C6X2G0_FRAOC|nr:hornerin-like [Frankliniella occidentalis]